MSTMKFVIQNCYTRMLYKNVIQNIIHNPTTFKVNIGYIYGYKYCIDISKALNIVYKYIINLYDIQNHKTSFHILVTNFYNALMGQ